MNKRVDTFAAAARIVLIVLIARYDTGFERPRSGSVAGGCANA
jgi:hypothetical protein